MKDMKINEATYPLENGEVGKIAVFMYIGSGDPRPNLEYAIDHYVGDNKNYHEFIDASLLTPWLRVIISNISDMEYLPFDEYIKRKNRTRKQKLERILK